MTEKHLCSRCAAQGLTCCQGKDRDIYITIGDVKRIKSVLGLENFYEFRKPTELSYLDDDDPVWASNVFRSDHSRRVLKRDLEGDCFFLRKAGCTLPSSVRPLVCRLHPFEYDACGLHDELAEGCPINLLNREQTVIQALGLNKEEASLWHQTLYNEILWEKENDEYRINL